MMSETERHQWITQILRALAELRESQRQSAQALGLDAERSESDDAKGRTLLDDGSP